MSCSRKKDGFPRPREREREPDSLSLTLHLKRGRRSRTGGRFGPVPPLARCPEPRVDAAGPGGRPPRRTRPSPPARPCGGCPGASTCPPPLAADLRGLSCTPDARSGLLSREAQLRGGKDSAVVGESSPPGAGCGRPWETSPGGCAYACGRPWRRPYEGICPRGPRALAPARNQRDKHRDLKRAPSCSLKKSQSDYIYFSGRRLTALDSA